MDYPKNIKFQYVTRINTTRIFLYVLLIIQLTTFFQNEKIPYYLNALIFFGSSMVLGIGVFTLFKNKPLWTRSP